MKQLLTILNLAIFAAILSLASCTKESKCEVCTLYLFNAELYTYQVEASGQESFALKPAETKQIEIKAGQTYTVTAKPNTFYAHNDFVKSVKCDGGCGDLLVTVEN